VKEIEEFRGHIEMIHCSEIFWFWNMKSLGHSSHGVNRLGRTAEMLENSD
jgi:hypothetical protein